MNTPSTPAPELQQCKSCSSSVNPDHRLCPVCNFPLKGTEQEQENYFNNLGYQKEQLKSLKNKTGDATVTFNVIALLTLLWGLISFFLNADKEDSIYYLIVYGILAIVYFVLGAWSRKQPIPAIICGLTLYVLGMIADMAAAPERAGSGIVIKVLIIAGLIRALVSAIKAKEIARTHKI